ncbi:signal peptide peptidase [Actinidia rufa]|uniref:Signal peptide peptidase n=1 Tax=Actinidia rufa TaxID=165716 RepID=A0A7J0GQI1_9ERIC|nr:signal peptide peptidase [Actinidia rufa]
MKVDPNLNVILTACLTVYVGCYRSVKPTPPSETMSNEHAMRFPLVGSAMLLSLFLLFKFLSKDLVNAVLTCYFFILGIVALSGRADLKDRKGESSKGILGLAWRGVRRDRSRGSWVESRGWDQVQEAEENTKRCKCTEGSDILKQALDGWETRGTCRENDDSSSEKGKTKLGRKKRATDSPGETRTRLVQYGPKIEQQWKGRGCSRGRTREVEMQCGVSSRNKAWDIDGSVIRSLWGGRWVKWECLRAEGTAGGILMMWDSRALTCLEYLAGSHSISCLFKNGEDGKTWAFARVYGPQSRGDRWGLWEELSGARAVWGTPWVCGGTLMWSGRATEGFKDFVRKWWDGYVVQGSPSYCLARKLRWLKEDLKRWNMEVFGRIEMRLSIPTKELQALESKEHLPGLSDDEKDRWVELKVEIGSGNASGINLVAWRVLCLPKKGGGLGVRDLRLFNKALLGKWIWRFARGEDKLWCRVIRGKYGTVRGAWRTKDVIHAHGTGLDSGYSNASSGQVSRPVRFGFISGGVCDGLLVLFPAGGAWAPVFTRGAQEWELEAFEEFFRLIQEVQPRSQEMDKWRWKRQGKGSFTVSSFYQSLTGSGDTTFLGKGVWVNGVPSKVCFFGWAKAKGAILTIDNLKRRRIVVTEWCYLCKGNAETTDHLLIHCQAASELWSLVLSIFGLPGKLGVFLPHAFYPIAVVLDSVHEVQRSKAGEPQYSEASLRGEFGWLSEDFLFLRLGKRVKQRLALVKPMPCLAPRPASCALRNTELSYGLEVEFTRSQIIAAIPGTFFCAWYALQKHWLANNILGLAFSIQV